jgi:hypothetical protein
VRDLGYIEGKNILIEKGASWFGSRFWSPNQPITTAPAGSAQNELDRRLRERLLGR